VREISATAPSLERRRPSGTIAATGRIHFWQGGSLWIGTGRGRSEWHTHHAHQIALALDGEFRFRTQRGAAWGEYTAVIVASHCPHEFELDGAAVAHLFVEPESLEGRALGRRFPPLEVSALPPAEARWASDALLRAVREGADGHALKATARAAVSHLSATNVADPATRLVDARIARALDFVAAKVRTAVSLSDAAEAAALSPSRFRHLFVQETGSSFRAYLLWLRINLAIEAATAGASWTEAAHAAGFSDSSHLTRTHKRMFGIEPTAIRQS
jgi:AraC family transcriptional regulator